MSNFRDTVYPINRFNSLAVRPREKVLNAEKFSYLEDIDGFRYPSYMSHSPFYGCLPSVCSCAFAVRKIQPQFRIGNEMKVLPRLQDKNAAKISLYRSELKDVGITNNLVKLNLLVLIITENGIEFKISGLVNEKISEFYNKKGRKYVPIPPRYFSPIEYFWLTIKNFKKLCRRHPTELALLIDDLCRKFCNHSCMNVSNVSSNLITAAYRNAKLVIDREFNKFTRITQQIKEIETFFKVYMEHEILESAFKEHHWFFHVLIKRLNKIKCNMDSLNLSQFHTDYYVEDFRLTKKRIYAIISKLDADMNRSAARTLSQRIASVEHYVEIVIQPLGAAQPELESESDEYDNSVLRFRSNSL